MNARSRITTGSRIATAAAALALGLMLSGCGDSTVDSGSAEPAPSSGTPATPSSAATGPAVEITEDMLLTESDLNEIAPGWQRIDTGSTDDGAFLRCQQETLAELGSTEVLVRTFERPSSDGPTTTAGQLIAVLPDEVLLDAANEAVNDWLTTCAEYATGGSEEPGWVAGSLVVDTVHATRPDHPGSGEAWGLTFDDDRTDEYGWFDSVGHGIGSPYLTVVRYGDWGQDANYELEQLPGVVLLQKALDKLPA
ncbi:MAG TPA: hypothetical protein VHO00_13390 [Actinomycetes bacterium]|jgi:hypothetical protein|nr:hypothetical protein [Actinomycetes bacterium]